MARSPDVRCSIAQALLEVGGRWSLLVIREAMMGSSRFDEFQARLGVARNILNDRLSGLVQDGILSRTPSPENSRIHYYRLTRKGEELLPVLAALMHWGDRWIHAKTGAPIVLMDRASGVAVQLTEVTKRDGTALKLRDIDITPGPGATAMMRKRLARQ